MLVLKPLCGCEQLVLPFGRECYLLHHAVDDNCKVRVLLEVDVLQHHRRGGSGEINVRIASRPCHNRALRVVKVYSSDILEGAVIRRDQFFSFFNRVSHCALLILINVLCRSACQRPGGKRTLRQAFPGGIRSFPFQPYASSGSEDRVSSHPCRRLSKRFHCR